MLQRCGLLTDQWHSFVNSLYQMRAAIFVPRRKGGSFAQAEKPEIQEPGRPEGLPRTAAITRGCRHKKAPAIVGLGRWCACILRGFSGPVAELAATGLTVALEQADEQRWRGVASRYNRFRKASRHAFRRSIPHKRLWFVYTA